MYCIASNYGPGVYHMWEKLANLVKTCYSPMFYLPVTSFYSQLQLRIHVIFYPSKIFPHMVIFFPAIFTLTNKQDWCLLVEASHAIYNLVMPVLYIHQYFTPPKFSNV